MKDFYPHAIWRSPLTPDSTVEGLIRGLISSNGEGSVILLIDPLSPTQKDEPSSLGRWPVFEGPPDVEEEPEQEG
jgi:hypothetical protein